MLVTVLLKLKANQTRSSSHASLTVVRSRSAVLVDLSDTGQCFRTCDGDRKWQDEPVVQELTSVSTNHTATAQHSNCGAGHCEQSPLFLYYTKKA